MAHIAMARDPAPSVLQDRLILSPGREAAGAKNGAAGQAEHSSSKQTDATKHSTRAQAHLVPMRASVR